ncbi:MAG: SRPBCC family protein [Acidimicrobiia bacterium]|nr:SRPBCC family protein [Acidimicrobiia bacterium]
MRYAEGPTVAVEVLVDAPPGVVWAVVGDVSVPARFSAELQAVEWLGGASGPAVGARFVGRNQHPAAGTWETTSTIVAWEPERALAWDVGEPSHPSASWRFDLEAAGSGTRLRQWARLGPGPSGLTIAIEAMPEKEERIIARRLEEHRVNMEATLAGIKALAEGPGAPSP